MIRAVKELVTVKPGGLIEVKRPDLPVGSLAEVIVMIEEEANQPPPLASLVGAGKGCFRTAEEADAFIRAERDRWEQ